MTRKATIFDFVGCVATDWTSCGIGANRQALEEAGVGGAAEGLRRAFGCRGRNVDAFLKIEVRHK